MRVLDLGGDKYSVRCGPFQTGRRFGFLMDTKFPSNSASIAWRGVTWVRLVDA